VGGGWVLDFTRLMLISTQVEVVVEVGVELGNTMTTTERQELLLQFFCPPHPSSTGPSMQSGQHQYHSVSPPASSGRKNDLNF